MGTDKILYSHEVDEAKQEEERRADIAVVLQRGAYHRVRYGTGFSRDDTDPRRRW